MGIYYNFPAEDDMNCPVKLFTSHRIYQEIEREALNQLLTAATVPGVLAVVGMPDLHQGYGLPIGGVMASEEGGPISPGAVGFDINCGVRLLKTGLTLEELNNLSNNLLQELRKRIPAGLGKSSSLKFSESEFKQIITQGLPALAQLNLLDEVILSRCEDQGSFPGADSSAVSKKAINRGITQLNTLGSGNHFLEVQQVVNSQPESDFKQGEVVVMLHTGSRGFGHQICKDYLKLAEKCQQKYNLSFPVKNLAHFPLNSPEGQDYLAAMGCAANFAYANRELLTQRLREIWRDLFPQSELKLYYDHTHNIARWETHIIAGQEQRVLVHRKGATRLSNDTPALIPGSMGTSSYVVKSLNSENTALALQSTAHGAGRKMSRTQAKKSITQEQHRSSLGEVKAVSSSGGNMLDESPLAYKDISLVIDSLQESQLAHPIARLKPLVVLKG